MTITLQLVPFALSPRLVATFIMGPKKEGKGSTRGSSSSHGEWGAWAWTNEHACWYRTRIKSSGKSFKACSLDIPKLIFSFNRWLWVRICRSWSPESKSHWFGCFWVKSDSFAKPRIRCSPTSRDPIYLYRTDSRERHSGVQTNITRPKFTAILSNYYWSNVERGAIWSS